jgi:pimeloyl-ACP methyl ester carboxylesterase
VLIAPAGLMRDTRIHWTSKLLYGEWLPQRLVEWIVWRRLGGTSSSASSQNARGDSEKVTPIQAAQQEGQPCHPALTPDSTAPISSRRPSVSISDIVTWQLHHHSGFVAAFVSSIQHAPISSQHILWTNIASSQNPCLPSSQRLLEGKVLLILGKEDTVIIAEEMCEDAQKVFGDKVEIKVLDGGHEVPVTDASIVAETILEFWG